ncbi:MAG: PilZ domain-containing protein [Deltaproteobacteria bacterium]|nr:PilZ domain-containing protein [Deltaproteobacteria bacterium]MBW2641515.1 PilZ domain-containing protein [Deltaproteobacteria bacterium]MBW2681538.1 PilZ domain-containing protein [Deltaproteobacteria bacterium]
MNDRIHKRNSLVNRIIDGSVTIDSVTKFEDLLKAFPDDPGLHRIYGDLLKKENSPNAATDAYETAAKLFIESGMTLQAIVSKLLEWQIFKPSQQEEQAFCSALYEERHEESAVQRFFTGMTYPEMMAFITKLMLENFPAGGRVKKFGDEENTLYFVVSGALEETDYHRLETGGRIQKKSTRDLIENDFFGEIYPFDQEIVSQSDINTITRVELAKISKSNLMNICRKYPNVKLLVGNLYKSRSEFVEKKAMRTVRRTARQKLPTQVSLKIFQDETGKVPLDVGGFTEDISLGGAQIVLGAKYQTGPADNLTGKNVKLKISLPISSVRLSILGIIVWSKEVCFEGKTTSVVGIQFKEMTDTDRGVLQEYYYGSAGEQNLIWSLWDSLMEK